MRICNIVILCIFGCLFFTQLSCERDDLCAASTQTTASLIIAAFDVSIPDDSKIILRLRIQGVGNQDVLETFNIVTTDSLVIPLRTDVNETQYRLHRDFSINDNGTPDDFSDDFTEGNEDIITVRYVRNDVFVSRACGFSTIFSNVSIEVEEDEDNWIQLIQAENDNQIVKNETQRHFKLLH